MEGLLASGERPVVHDTGRPVNPNRKSNYPDAVFAATVARIRNDLIAQGERPTGTLDLNKLESIEALGGKSEFVKPAIRDTVSGADRIDPTGGAKAELTLTTVSDALRSITKPKLNEFHNIPDYATAFEGFDRKVSKVIGGGSDSIALRLEDGNVLKITTRELPDDLGKRVFDMPVLEQGSRTLNGRQVNYFVQPFAEAARPTDLHIIGEAIQRSNYDFMEPFLNQVGRYQGRPWLLDPFAVRKQ